MCVLEPEYSFMQLLFEVISAFGTVGLSTGITPDLGVAGKLVILIIMFIGRLGRNDPAFHVDHHPEPTARYTEEHITVG